MLSEEFVYEKGKTLNKRYQDIPKGSKVKFRRKHDPVVHYGVCIGDGQFIDYRRGIDGWGFLGPGVRNLLQFLIFFQ